MKRKQQHDGTHLTLEERKIIQAGIENSATKADIARTIGKDATTVAKEIRNHRVFKPRNTFNNPLVCGNRKSCPTKPCVKNAKTMWSLNAIDATSRPAHVINAKTDKMPTGQVLLQCH